MRTNQFRKAALFAALAELLLDENEPELFGRPEPICHCHCHEPRRTRPMVGVEPRAPWGVCDCHPREDKNKVFGLHVEVDEPRREDYCSRWAFERDHAKFDRLVDAAEACDWENKSNTAPKHRVNAIRKSVFEPPVLNRQLVGETHWF